MRTVGLLALAIFFPIFVYAAALVNINTADATLLDTLPGIGPSKAAAIIDYRTQHGMFSRIEDIQNVSGIGPSTYAGLASFITVGDTGTSTAPVTVTASSTPDVITQSGGSTIYIPPSALSVHISGNRESVLEVPMHFSARVMTKSGDIDPLAQISWSFGDGSSASGSAGEKTYRYAGIYLVTVDAVDGTIRARDEMVITVKPAKVRITVVPGDGIKITNDSSNRIDLSGWRLLSGGNSFRIPDGMIILPETSVLLPFAITNLPMTSDAELLYPGGIVAAKYAPIAVVQNDSVFMASTTNTAGQLSSTTNSYTEVQTVERSVAYDKKQSIIGIKDNIQSHEETVNAPAAATELAAAGATSASTSTKVGGFFRSPWTLGFLSIMTLAGGAFIFL